MAWPRSTGASTPARWRAASGCIAATSARRCRNGAPPPASSNSPSFARAVFECEATDPAAARLLEQATLALEDLALAIDPRGKLPLAVSGSIGERLVPRMRPFVRSRIVAARAGAAEGALMVARRAARKETEAAL
ncbi:hypothetical protein [Ramlibacter montanisoli]|uniref:hypothetical protein n=1 Tax=Ramlibacter montanisoli TaxID=2732512 RepID=UPI00209C0697|nr:hypothetical protein [Ramlibacter montanisoli]